MDTKEIIKEKLRGKKGILIFDMDGVLNTFVRAFDKEELLHYYIKPAYLTEKFKNYENEDSEYLRFQGISVDVIDYLATLKDDYVLMTNTSWSANSFNSMKKWNSLEDLEHDINNQNEWRYKGSHFPLGLFDIYGGGAGEELTLSLSSPHDIWKTANCNSRINDRYLLNNYSSNKDVIVTESDRTKGESHLINKFIIDIINDMQNDGELSEDFRMIQFEDEWNGSLETPEYVFINFHAYIDYLSNKGPQHIIEDNQEFYREFYKHLGDDSIEEKRLKYNKDSKTYTTAFPKDGNSVMYWLQKNLK